MSAQTLTDRIDAVRGGRRATLPQRPAGIRWRTATEADIDAMHAVMAAADAVDHPAWLTPREDIVDTFDLPHIDHSRDTLLAVVDAPPAGAGDAGDAPADASPDAPEGTVVAFGSAFLHPARVGALVVNIGGAVHPAWRRRGIGAALLEWQRARGLDAIAAAAAEGLPPADEDWTAELKVYAEESNDDHRAIAERAGFTPERWFTTMERDMAGDVPAVAAPAGLRIVAYTHDRADDVRESRNDAFRDHWGSQPSAPETWAKFVGGAFFRPDLSRLALDADGAVFGFCLSSVNEADWVTMGASHAYIDLIGVVRGSRRRGVAPAVIADALAAIASAGLERAVLDVDTASPTGAHTLYEGLGFRPTERSLVLCARI